MSNLIEKLQGAYSTVFERSLAKKAVTEIRRLQKELDKLHIDYVAEKACQKYLAIRILGQEAYDNSPCQAHPLELVEQAFLEIQQQLKTDLARERTLTKRIIPCDKCGDSYFDSGFSVGCPICKLAEKTKLAERSIKRLVELSEPGFIGALRGARCERADKAEAELDKAQDRIDELNVFISQSS